MTPFRLSFLLALAFALLRLAFIGHIQLAPDEAYYWEWSRHLDLSYYDQGPMLALAIKAGTWLLGTNEWGVRLAAVLCGLGVSTVLAWIAGRLGKPGLGPWLVLSANGMLLYSVGAVLMIHDSLAGLFWCLALALSFKAHEDDDRFWLLAGLLGGLGVLAKYTAILVLPCLFLACALHPAFRRHLKAPWLWLAALLGGLACGFPIVTWNVRHGWPSLQHVASLGGVDGSRVSLQAFPEFLLSQFGLVTPILFALVLSAWLWAWRMRREPGPGAERRWLLLACSCPVFLLFLLLSLRSRVEGNWPAPAWMAALPLTALWLDDLGALWGRMSRWALGVSLALTLLVHAQAAWGVLPLPAGLDTTYRVQGWRELAGRVEAERSALGAQAFVACRTYQNAAELAFYLPGHERPLILQRGRINHQYRFWNDFKPLLGRDAILVTGQAWEVNEMREVFASVEELPSFEASRRGVAMRLTRLYRGRGFAMKEGW